MLESTRTVAQSSTMLRAGSPPHWMVKEGGEGGREGRREEREGRGKEREGRKEENDERRGKEGGRGNISNPAV